LLKESSIEYINENGALIKGELKEVFGKVVGIKGWMINHFLIERKIKEFNKKELHEILLDEGIKKDKLKKIMDYIEGDKKLIYNDIMHGKQSIWFRDKKHAIEYVNKNLTEEIIKRESIKREKIKEDKIDKVYFIKKQDSYTKEDVEVKIDKKNFINRYGLDKNKLIDNFPADQNNIERALTKGGLYNEDLSKIKRLIIRNPEFIDFLKINGNYNENNIIKIGQLFANSNKKEKEEFLEDFQYLFSRNNFIVS